VVFKDDSGVVMASHPKFFISFSSADRDTARLFCSELEKRNIPCWIDERDIEPGSQWSGEIVDAIDHSAGMILLLSENSNRSVQVGPEVERAVSRGKPLFPVRIVDVQPSKELILRISNRQWVDLTERPFNIEKLDGLARALRKALQLQHDIADPDTDSEPVASAQEPLRQRPSMEAKPGATAKSIEKPRPFPHRALEFERRYAIVANLLSLAIACTCAWWIDSEIADNNQASVIAQRLFSIALGYEQIVSFGPRQPEPERVFLLEINNKTGVDDRNVCEERQFLGEMLKSLALARPRVVVIDKFFPNRECGAATGNLLAGMVRLCQSQATVIVGRSVDDDALRNGSPIPFPLDAAIDFRKAGATCVNEGVVNLDPDFRRVSLFFPEVQSLAHSDSPPPSLPLAAALAYPNHPDLSEWSSAARPPFASILRAAQFERLKRNANAFVCGSGGAWRACQEKELRPDLKELALAKVVVIGEVDPNDRHETVLGQFDGYLLQANYIESILDRRLIRPAPEWMNWLAGLVVFVCFEYLFPSYVGAWFLVRLAALGASLVLITYLCVLLGHYVNPIAVAGLAIVCSSILRLAAAKIKRLKGAPARRG
jgi:CHASE2 domain-containing sensor protein